MNVFINRKEYTLPEGATVFDALQAVQNITLKGIAVALNNDVVASTDWESTTLNDSDKITIIRAFYGG